MEVLINVSLTDDLAALVTDNQWIIITQSVAQMKFKSFISAVCSIAVASARAWITICFTE